MKENTLKVMALIGKIAGVIVSLNAIPFVPQEVGMLIFAGASILKDTVNRIGDLMDDGKVNNSWR